MECITIMDTDYHPIYNKDIIINEPREVIVDGNIWIGCNVIILKGTNIANGNIISAGSIICGSLEKENTIYGFPKQLIVEKKNNIRWSQQVFYTNLTSNKSF